MSEEKPRPDSADKLPELEKRTKISDSELAMDEQFKLFEMYEATLKRLLPKVDQAEALDQALKDFSLYMAEAKIKFKPDQMQALLRMIDVFKKQPLKLIKYIQFLTRNRSEPPLTKPPSPEESPRIKERRAILEQIMREKGLAEPKARPMAKARQGLKGQPTSDIADWRVGPYEEELMRYLDIQANEAAMIEDIKQGKELPPGSFVQGPDHNK